MSRSTLALASVCALLLATGEAAGNPLIVSAGRYVEIGSEGAPIFTETLGGAGAFSKSISHPIGVPGGNLESVAASQNSSVDGSAGVFAGSGSASISYSVLASQGVYASSFFDVFFDLAVPHAYVLAGGLTAMDDGGFARARLGLSGPVSFSFLAIGTDPNTPLSGSGVLPAGSYRLVVEASMDNGGNFQEGAYMGGSSEFAFQMEVAAQGTPVPEPAMWLLLAIGLAWGTGRRARG
jgi:hypothetical protein